MVQVTFDTNNDTLEELQHSLKLLQQAIERKGAKNAHKADMPVVEEETAIDTPFFKVTVKEEHKEVPTLNQLIEDESLSEDELSKMFREQVASEKHVEKPKEKSSDAFIEIVEYPEEKQS